MRALLLSFSIILLLGACTKTEQLQRTDFAYDYFPLQVGNVITYHVDSTVYSDDSENPIQEFHFELKDSTVNNYLDKNGDTTYAIKRFKKTLPAGEWRYQKTFERRRFKSYAEETTDNQTFVKLLFPPVLSLTWNGHSKSHMRPQDYYIKAYPFSEHFDGMVLDSLIVVNQKDEKKMTAENFVEETYAQGIGLVKKEFRELLKDARTGEIIQGTICLMKIKLN